MWTPQRNVFHLAMVSFISILSSASAETLQQPKISLTCPDGVQVWGPNAHAKITKGHSFVVMCFVDFSNATGRLILIFSGSNITESNVSLTASFSCPVAEYKHQGNYSCVYEATLPSGNVTSTKSAAIYVIITFPWLLLVYSVVPAILLMLLVSLVVCLVLRRRRQAKQSEGQIQITVTNRYEDDDEEEEEEERDYVNVEPLGRKQTEEIDEVDEEETDVHDYENLENEGKKGEEDTDETTDDEHDYVNIAE
ncbi:uncharacterized protein LOC115785268 [Archocentrus centrarchus]|uniref:uncharacterized protein LOC115785268 n=1 Tax=Archocentrus centrarchus TaxID=63155 RepID=UPI0011EA3C5A|nr:uncharacterized protein LOC115785268 [Archocentrus centrarchus]